jgi:hypothetical protein
LTLTIVTDLDGIATITGDPRAMIGLVIGLGILGILGTGVAYILTSSSSTTSEPSQRRARPTSLRLSPSPSAGSSSKNRWTSWTRPPSSNRRLPEICQLDLIALSRCTVEELTVLDPAPPRPEDPHA